MSREQVKEFIRDGARFIAGWVDIITPDQAQQVAAAVHADFQKLGLDIDEATILGIIVNEFFPDPTQTALRN